MPSQKSKHRKLNRMMQTGPVLAAALVAEKVLHEPDDVMSLIRIVDRVLIPSELATAMSAGAALKLPLFVYFAIKAGDFSGKCSMQVYQIGPSRQEKLVSEDMEITFVEDEPDGGFNLFMPAVIQWEGEGRYWYEMRLDKIPFCRLSVYVCVGTMKHPKKSSITKQGT